MSSEARQQRFASIAADVTEPVRRYLARRTDAATADDVLGEVLLVCWRRIDEVPDEPLPWVYGVARRALANAERSARRQRRVAARVATLDPPREEVEAQGGPEAVAVRAALRELPGRDAELLRMWAWEDLSPAEIAVVLEISPNAAAIRLHRAREKLRGRLARPASSPGARKTGGVAGHEESMEGRGR